MLILIILHTIILISILITGFKLINSNNENEFQTRLTHWFLVDAQIYHVEQMKKMDGEIRINGKRKHLGLFKNEHDAHLAYQNKLKEIK